MFRQIAMVTCLFPALFVNETSVFAIEPPDYNLGVLEHIFPAGGQRGTTVQVRFGTPSGGLIGANKVIIDGPPGITVENIKNEKSTFTATFVIADDAPIGRRMVRLAGGPTGLTNFRWFVVGQQPEFIEKERNNTLQQANKVTTPVIINGRVQTALDQDCYRFRGTKGQSLVAAVNSHGLDAMGYGRDNSGFVDTSLELLDPSGKVIAGAEDSIGFDPIIRHTLPEDGEYTVRISGLGYRGFPQAVYRLTLGDIGYVTAVFPPGGQRGQTVPVKLSGLNFPGDTAMSVKVGKDGHPVQYITPTDKTLVAHDLAFIRGDLSETMETEPNNERKSATPLAMDSTVNGQFQQDGDDDWYKMELDKGERIELEIAAQRHLRSPVDTLVEVFDSEGKRLAGNDDGAIFDGMTSHDFRTFDSFLTFVSKKKGIFFVRVSEQTGTFGPLANYRLTCRRETPNFRVYHWPDAIPVWGPGSSSVLAVEVIRTGRLQEDIEFTVEGLPEGWQGSSTISTMANYRAPLRWHFGTRVFLTITAPKDAKVGDMVPLRIIGRTKVGNKKIEHVSQAMTTYVFGNHRFRVSPVTRAVVARPQAMSLNTKTESLQAVPGETLKVPVTVTHHLEKPEPFSLNVNSGKNHVRCNMGAPIACKPGQSEITVPVTIPDTTPPGPLDVVVALQWRSDIRVGLPGPCTRLIRIDVRKK